MKLSVGENLPAGAEVGTIAAYDADQDGPIFYYIQGNNLQYKVQRNKKHLLLYLCC